MIVALRDQNHYTSPRFWAGATVAFVYSITAFDEDELLRAVAPFRASAATRRRGRRRAPPPGETPPPPPPPPPQKGGD